MPSGSRCVEKRSCKAGSLNRALRIIASPDSPAVIGGVWPPQSGLNQVQVTAARNDVVEKIVLHHEELPESCFGLPSTARV